MRPEPTAPLDALLAQQAWVRALARSLVRSDADADDLAQEAWVAAMRAPPSSAASARGWFASVLRNAARMRHRGDVRRSDREERAARPEGEPGAAEVVARAEEQRRVADAVLGLAEPYRTAVLLRFLEELPPREVAARTGVPVETARSRIQRGLAQLRERLDAAHGGDGSAWKAALLPLTGFGADRAAAAAAAASQAAGSASHAAPAASFTTGAMAMASTGTVAAVGIVALLVGAGGAWLAGGSDREAAVAERDAKIQAEQSAAEARNGGEQARADLRRRDQRIAELDGEVRRLGDALKAAEGRAAQLETDLAAARASADRASPGAPRPVQGPAFEFPALSAAFAKVDWDAVAEHMSAMPALLDQIATARRDGTELPAKALGEVQQHNGPLVTIAVQLAQSGAVTGTGANGAFTHPAFAVNALAASLERLGKPLSKSQLVSLGEIGQRFTTEEAERVARYTDATFQLQKLEEEGALKVRFFEAVRKVLTREQLDAASPPSTRDRVAGDLWSAGIFWLQFAVPVRFETQEKLVDDIARRASAVLKLTEEQKPKASSVVADWAGRLPQSFRERKVDALERVGSMPTATAQFAAAETRKLVERLATDLVLDGDSLAAARRMGFVLVPTPAPDSEDD